jgi:integrase
MPVLKLTVKEVQQRVDHVRIWNECPIKLKGNEPKDVFLYDSQLQGFGCKVTAGGKASWFVEKRFGNQKNIRKKLGNYPGLSIEEARRQGQIVLGQIASGVDVSKDRRESLVRQQETLNGKTLAGCYAEYFAILDGDPRYRKEQRQAFEKWIAPILGNVPPKQLRKADLRTLLNGLGKSTHLQCYKMLTKFFKWMSYNDIIENNPMAAIQSPKKHKERKRIATENEIKLYWSAAERLGYPIGTYYQFILLTGQRKSETRLAQWTQINFQERVWRIPEENTKNEEPHLVHLSDQAIAVLRQCPTAFKWCFTTFGPDPVAVGSDNWAELLALMSRPDWSLKELRAKIGNDYTTLVGLSTIEPELKLHDVRRSAASIMVNKLGVQPHVVHRILNHEQKDTLDKSYLQYEMLPERKAALKTWGRYVAGLVSPAKVEGRTFTIATSG